MTLTVDLSDETKNRLAQKAQAAGIDMPTFAARVLQAEALRPPLDAALRAVREAFAASGMTDEELTETLEKEKHEARAAKRGQPFSE